MTKLHVYSKKKFQDNYGNDVTNFVPLWEISSRRYKAENTTFLSVLGLETGPQQHLTNCCSISVQHRKITTVTTYLTPSPGCKEHKKHRPVISV